MGRFALGCTLLALFLALGLWISSTADSQLLPIAQTLDRAAEQALSDDPDQAILDASIAQKKWETVFRTIATFSDHEPMEKIDSLFAELACWKDDPRHYAACCRELSAMIRALAGVHEPNWWNLLSATSADPRPPAPAGNAPVRALPSGHRPDRIPDR